MKLNIFYFFSLFFVFSLFAGEWGETIKGVKTRLDTQEKVIALTFDACCLSLSHCKNRYDAALIDYLVKNQIKATLFVSGYWVDTYSTELKKIASYPFFEIANHGLKHKPCSIDGKKAYGIQGTRNLQEMMEEIVENGIKIKKLLNITPRYYRSGTNFYDTACIEMAQKNHYEVVGYTISGDQGATLSPQKVAQELLKAKPGFIYLFHFNKPGSGTLQGLQSALPKLKQQGYNFVLLSEFPLK